MGNNDDIKNMSECPDCASQNIVKGMMREQIICRDCGLIFEPLAPAKPAPAPRAAKAAKKVAARKPAKKAAKKAKPKKAAKKAKPKKAKPGKKRRFGWW